jgi:hypothetical protein
MSLCSPTEHETGRLFTPMCKPPVPGEDEEGGAQGIKMISTVPRIVFSKEDTKSTQFEKINSDIFVSFVSFVVRQK